MTMVEIVARAICLAGNLPDDVRKDCETLCLMCLDEARAAIKAYEKANEDHWDHVKYIDPEATRPK